MTYKKVSLQPILNHWESVTDKVFSYVETNRLIHKIKDRHLRLQTPRDYRFDYLTSTYKRQVSFRLQMVSTVSVT